jgi:hypothetical protein
MEGTENGSSVGSALNVPPDSVISRVGPNEENDVRALPATCIPARFC